MEETRECQIVGAPTWNKQETKRLSVNWRRRMMDAMYGQKQKDFKI